MQTIKMEKNTNFNKFYKKIETLKENCLMIRENQRPKHQFQEYFCLGQDADNKNGKKNTNFIKFYKKNRDYERELLNDQGP